MTEFKKHLLEYAERELRLIGFMQIQFGPVCLEFLEKCADVTESNPEVMKQICEILPRLVDLQLLSPVTEKDFALHEDIEGDKKAGILRCVRYPYLYKTPDGKYWNDRAIAFRYNDSNENDLMYLYQSGNSSKQQVELPYYPETKIVTLDEIKTEDI